ncbi:MAG: hypothetical protein WCG95_00025 [bacterium]
MSLIYKPAESLVKPLETDETLNQNGVYMRQNITSKTYSDSDGTTKTKWSYEEAFLTTEEYNNYVLVQSTIASTELKRENTIIDEYTLKLIEEGRL